ncbi:hypothetical protein ACWNYO_00555 [Candidatus Vidania fulgoroideorum]
MRYYELIIILKEKYCKETKDYISKLLKEMGFFIIKYDNLGLRKIKKKNKEINVNLDKVSFKTLYFKNINIKKISEINNVLRTIVLNKKKNEFINKYNVKKYLDSIGRILPRKINKLKINQQRKISKCIKILNNLQVFDV